MRRAVTVLVVVLIAVLAGGLVTHAVIKVREAEACSQCRNNLRQVSLALQNYYDSSNTFPAGTVPNPDLPLGQCLSWQYAIIPYMEAMMDPSWRNGLNKPWDAEDSREFNSQPYRPYLCPAASAPTGPNGYGLTHYVGIAGVGPDAQTLPLSDRKAGVFGYERKARLEDIKDGRDTTLLVIETATANGPWAAAGPSTVRGLDPDGPFYLGRDGQFSSRHRRVTNAVFVDGSVRPLSESLSPQVLEAFATIAGGEAADPIEGN